MLGLRRPSLPFKGKAAYPYSRHHRAFAPRFHERRAIVMSQDGTEVIELTMSPNSSASRRSRSRPSQHFGRPCNEARSWIKRSSPTSFAAEYGRAQAQHAAK